MIDKFKKTMQQAGDLLKEQAGNLGEGAKEKSYQLFEQWARVFPQLKAYGLDMTSFAISVTLNPSMEVHLKGKAADFVPEKLRVMQEECDSSALLSSVFKAIQTTYQLHEKTEAELFESIFVKIIVTIPPEIKVYLGQPIIE